MPDIQDYDGKRYYLREAPHGEDGCMGCYFNRGSFCGSSGQTPSCSPQGRTDGRSVIFVGPPTEIPADEQPRLEAVEPTKLKPIPGYIENTLVGRIMTASEAGFEIADLRPSQEIEALVTEIRRLREFIHANAR